MEVRKLGRLNLKKLSGLSNFQLRVSFTIPILQHQLLLCRVFMLTWILPEQKL